MKQVILSAVIAALGINLTSCGGSSSKSPDGNSTNIVKLEAAPVGVAAKNIDKNNYITVVQTVSATYADTVNVDTARMAINAYSVNAAELTSYIVAVANAKSGISNLHFLLGVDKGTTTLYVCAVNTTNGHTYLQGNGADSVVLSCMPTYTVVPGTVSRTPGSYVTINLPPAIDTVSIDSALKMTGNYTQATQPQVDKTALSFIVDYSSVQTYINSSNGTIVYFEACLANDFNRLTLVMVGLDINGKPVYMSDANNDYYILEHCMPCPTCNVTRSGYGLE